MKEGWDSSEGNSPIIPILLGTDEQAVNMQRHLEENGLLTIAIRPPTVPEGSSRLRLTVKRNVPKHTLEKLISYMRTKK